MHAGTTTLFSWIICCGALAQGGSLRIYPQDLQLDALNDVPRITIIHEEPSGYHRDVSAECQIKIEPHALAAVEGSHVRPLQIGTGTLSVHWQALQATVPLNVRSADTRWPISFRNDVEPVLMRAGCNSGACHGNARGQEGFALTLFGYDPAFDHRNLTRDMSTRRVNVVNPSQSLILRKPLGELEHGGGIRLRPESLDHNILHAWIAAGVPDDPPHVKQLTDIQVAPNMLMLRPNGQPAQLSVRAYYSDGSDRDVSQLAVYTSMDEGVVLASRDGSILSSEPGEVFVMVRFGTLTEVCQVLVINDQPMHWPEGVTPSNYIDDAVFTKLRKLRVPPAQRCDDRTFARRVYIDIVGKLPTPNELSKFIASGAANKRSALINALLQAPELPEIWAMKWADVLRIESTQLNRKGVQLYSDWLRDAIQSDLRMDELARQLLTAEGGNYHNAAANFFVLEDQPHLMAENVAQVFTGIRIQCAQCHNHPFERWTQDDYYSFAAFFAQIGKKQGEDPREQIVYNRRSGEVRHPRDNRVMPPKFLGGTQPQIQPDQDRRAVLAAWLTAPDNPWFAKNLVNRTWAHFMGRGLIDPVDDVRISNPASHPQLLADMANRFRDSKYDLRSLIRDICNSTTYQLSSVTTDKNAHDQRNFSHAQIRRIPAEVLLDLVSQVTAVPEKFAGLPLGSRAVQIADAHSGSYFLKTFGRPKRQSACTCERRDDPTLSQALHLINGATIWTKLRHNQGRVAQLCASQMPDNDIITELFALALCREASVQEREVALRTVQAAETKRQGFEDVLWALLNSQEFVFNH